MKIVTIIARILLGLVFVVFGFNGFFHFIHMPPPTNPAAGQFFSAVSTTGFMSVVFFLQIIGGLLVLLGFFVPLGLTILCPIIVNIVLFHVCMATGGPAVRGRHFPPRAFPDLALLGELRGASPAGRVIIFHDPRCADYSAAGHPERPARVTASARHLQATHPDWEWREPNEVTEEALLRAHTATHTSSGCARPATISTPTRRPTKIFSRTRRALPERPAPSRKLR